MPVVSSSMRLFATPLLYTQFGMVSVFAYVCLVVLMRVERFSSLFCSPIEGVWGRRVMI